MVVRARIVVRGIVQGVGFRPFIHHIAHEHLLNGWVLNSTEGVVIEVEGPERNIQPFVNDISAKAPPLALIERVETTMLPPVGYQSFVIETSQSNNGGFVLVSPDICTCQDCQRELFDPADRRFRYPFTNCTNCGPRFTIIQDIPYDRPKTTMKNFTMCPRCEAEYHDPANRRFHAQPNACPECGPQVWLEASPSTGRTSPSIGSTGRALAGDSRAPQILTMHDRAIEKARELLASGSILAIKGLGGFHLACDATSDEAVGQLRERKRRVDKPFAVMSIDAGTVAQYCFVDEQERQLLESPQRPIVLLRRRPEAPISRLVAPGNDYLGVMLPYTPLHFLLLRRERDAVVEPAPGSTHKVQETTSGATGDGEDGDARRSDQQMPLALVMTSGNISEEPLAIDNDEALERLATLADYFLMHDRGIHIRCDDSVTRLHEGREMIVRRSRGYAPFPVRLRFAEPQETLACGGELKNTFCLAKGNYAFLSQHIGDLQNYETLKSYEESIEHFRNLFRVNPTLIAHDMHPDYLSTKYALDLVQRSSGRLGLIPVQHHEAHVASCMAENEVYEPVIGVAFDGTGFGRDGNIWGGEFFIGDYASFRRVAHFGYVPMPGGEGAIRRPYRMAFSHLYNAYGEDCLSLPIPFIVGLDSSEQQLLIQQVRRGLNAPLTSSSGRLFDAVSSLIGVRHQVNYEGQAAIEMEMLADPDIHDGYRWRQTLPDEGTIVVIEPDSIIRAVVEDIERGVAPSTIAARFHNTMAEVVGEVCSIISGRTGLRIVALSGGVFQNTFLLNRTLAQLRSRGLQPLVHHQVPTNDGGIALGQVMIANAQYETGVMSSVSSNTSQSDQD
ncbi:MAG: carbamoyltransferase HypF [Chloroflexota bacterium]